MGAERNTVSPPPVSVATTLKEVTSPAGRAQLVRYGITSISAASVYIGLTLLLSGVAGVPIQLAIPVAYALALCVHFSLQRWFVFRDAEAFSLAIHHQIGRYLVLAFSQYAITALATAYLPDAIGVPEQVVYVCTVLVLAAVAFILVRTRVFH
jgi:putative flippase GtrA